MSHSTESLGPNSVSGHRVNRRARRDKFRKSVFHLLRVTSFELLAQWAHRQPRLMTPVRFHSSWHSTAAFLEHLVVYGVCLLYLCH
jgi:hypothetical protein